MWATSIQTIHHRIVNVLDFVDVLQDASFASNVVNLHIVSLGAETPSVAPTPQKRGPPPLPSRRGGRLPSCLAVKDRPLSLPVTTPAISTYKNLLIAQLEPCVPQLLRVSRIAPAAR